MGLLTESWARLEVIPRPEPPLALGKTANAGLLGLVPSNTLIVSVCLSAPLPAVAPDYVS